MTQASFQSSERGREAARERDEIRTGFLRVENKTRTTAQNRAKTKEILCFEIS